MNRIAITDNIRAQHQASANQNAAMGEAVISSILMEAIRRGQVKLTEPLAWATRIDPTIHDDDIVELSKGTGYFDIAPPAYIAAQENAKRGL